MIYTYKKIKLYTSRLVPMIDITYTVDMVRYWCPLSNLHTLDIKDVLKQHIIISHLELVVMIDITYIVDIVIYLHTLNVLQILKKKI